MPESDPPVPPIVQNAVRQAMGGDTERADYRHVVPLGLVQGVGFAPGFGVWLGVVSDAVTAMVAIAQQPEFAARKFTATDVVALTNVALEHTANAYTTEMRQFVEDMRDLTALAVPDAGPLALPHERQIEVPPTPPGFRIVRPMTVEDAHGADLPDEPATPKERRALATQLALRGVTGALADPSVTVATAGTSIPAAVATNFALLVATADDDREKLERQLTAIYAPLAHQEEVASALGDVLKKSITNMQVLGARVVHQVNEALTDPERQDAVLRALHGEQGARLMERCGFTLAGPPPQLLHSGPRAASLLGVEPPSGLQEVSENHGVELTARRSGAQKAREQFRENLPDDVLAGFASTTRNLFTRLLLPVAGAELVIAAFDMHDLVKKFEEQVKELNEYRKGAAGQESTAAFNVATRMVKPLTDLHDGIRFLDDTMVLGGVRRELAQIERTFPESTASLLEPLKRANERAASRSARKVPEEAARYDAPALPSFTRSNSLTASLDHRKPPPPARPNSPVAPQGTSTPRNPAF